MVVWLTERAREEGKGKHNRKSTRKRKTETKSTHMYILDILDISSKAMPVKRKTSSLNHNFIPNIHPSSQLLLAPIIMPMITHKLVSCETPKLPHRPPNRKCRRSRQSVQKSHNKSTALAIDEGTRKKPTHNGVADRPIYGLSKDLRTCIE